MRLYDRLADLPVTVAGYDLRRRERETPDFTRVTTTFRVHGDGETGRGEDVCYEAADHDALHRSPPAIPTGTFTFEEFSAALADADLFPEPPDQHHAPAFRRWAVESAVLDLALRQRGTDLASALGRTYDPVRFVVSTTLGDDGYDRVEQLLAVNPDAEFKLDPEPGWDDDLVARLSALDRVRIVDLKGLYEDEDVGEPADPAFYRRIRDGFPDAVVEDPELTDETRPVLADDHDRISWDYPVTGPDSVAALPFEPDWLNIKPSRFGTVESLLDTVEWALERDVQLYGGGQFELGVGRQHGHALAALFYPDGPNDLAPAGYNDPDPASDLPASPLDPPADPQGLSWT